MKKLIFFAALVCSLLAVQTAVAQNPVTTLEHNGTSQRTSTTTTTQESNKKNGHIEKVKCSSCGGTGINSSPSYGASYGLSKSSDKRCEVCGKYENHRHDNCIPCQGKGYIEKYVR